MSGSDGPMGTYSGSRPRRSRSSTFVRATLVRLEVSRATRRTLSRGPVWTRLTERIGPRPRVRGRASAVGGDRLPGHGADETVGPEGQARVRQARPDHDPVRLDVREVVEQEPAHRDGLQVLEARGPAPARQLPAHQVV